MNTDEPVEGLPAPRPARSGYWAGYTKCWDLAAPLIRQLRAEVAALSSPKGVTDYFPDEDQVGSYLRIAGVTTTKDAYYLGRKHTLESFDGKDAERYRWIKDQFNAVGSPAIYWNCRDFDCDLCGDTLDAAIDQARRKP